MLCLTGQAVAPPNFSSSVPASAARGPSPSPAAALSDISRMESYLQPGSRQQRGRPLQRWVPGKQWMATRRQRRTSVGSQAGGHVTGCHFQGRA